MFGLQWHHRALQPAQCKCFVCGFRTVLAHQNFTIILLLDTSSLCKHILLSMIAFFPLSQPHPTFSNTSSSGCSKSSTECTLALFSACRAVFCTLLQHCIAWRTGSGWATAAGACAAASWLCCCHFSSTLACLSISTFRKPSHTCECSKKSKWEHTAS